MLAACPQGKEPGERVTGDSAEAWGSGERCFDRGNDFVRKFVQEGRGFSSKWLAGRRDGVAGPRGELAVPIEPADSHKCERKTAQVTTALENVVSHSRDNGQVHDGRPRVGCGVYGDLFFACCHVWLLCDKG